MSGIVRFGVHLCLAIASVGFGLSLLANIVSYLPSWFPIFQQFLWLVTGTFVLFLPAVWVGTTDVEANRLMGNRWFISHHSKLGRQIEAARVRYVPSWVRKFFTAIFVYTLIILVVEFLYSLVTQEHNDLESQATLRGMSAICMSFYAYFWMLFYTRARHLALTGERPSADLRNPGRD